MLKNRFCLLLITILFAGCNKYGYVNINYPQVPAINLPENVKTIALVNRSLTNSSEKQNRIKESVITAEVAGSDRLASDECLKGVFDRVKGNSRFKCVIPSKTRLYGTGTRETPELLSWKQVKAICDSVHADALLVLEVFDSNTDLIIASMTDQVRKVLNNQPPRPSIPNQIKVDVLIFWRLYDPSTQSIIDQFQSTDNTVIKGAGTDSRMLPPDALGNIAYNAGRQYIARFLPSYYTVKRDMYKKGKGAAKNKFSAAFRRAEVANWQEAINMWQDVSKNYGSKNAGRACLDIAVSYEVLGNIDLAIEWAKKAYEDYEDELARDYIKSLLRRKNLE